LHTCYLPKYAGTVFPLCLPQQKDFGTVLDFMTHVFTALPDWKPLRAITDKDDAEISAVRSVSKNMFGGQLRVMVCYFHVMQALDR
jgi:hypothetical protein